MYVGMHINIDWKLQKRLIEKLILDVGYKQTMNEYIRITETTKAS